ncbi:hypothetical protein DH2020_043383 [Rehmannia glutinosa]|uniref:Uncharacterized protein n=1 Tax=Rehmannia glutinosa TaxID=99300 RepID=A0ABR0UKG7_REHGL
MANSLHSANGNHTVPVPGQEDTQYVVVQESDACDAILPNDPKIGVTEIQEFAAKHEERQILVIDDTAVIETSRIGIGKFDRNRQEIKKEKKKKKKPKRRDVKAWKRKENVEEGNHSHVSVEKKGKKRLNLVYSREEMEALRFEGLEDQKRKWVEVYCELGALVAQEYDGLVNSANIHQNHNLDPRARFQKSANIETEKCRIQMVFQVYKYKVRIIIRNLTTPIYTSND